MSALGHKQTWLTYSITSSTRSDHITKILRLWVRPESQIFHGGAPSLLTLKKIVPNLVQLGDCRLQWQDKELLILTSNETKPIERLERVGNLEINIDRKAFCEPPLDAGCNVGRRWRCLRLADEMICKGRLLGLLVLGSGDQIVKNARIIIDIAKIDIFGELHVILQGLMLIFQPLAHRKATERHDTHQGNECPFKVGVFNRPRSAEINPRHKE